MHALSVIETKPPSGAHRDADPGPESQTTQTLPFEIVFQPVHVLFVHHA